MSSADPSSLVTLTLDQVSYHYPKRWWSRAHLTETISKRSSESSGRGVDELRLTLKGGLAVGVTGPNGAGKSTLFKLLCGDLYAQRGALYLDDVEITRAPRWRRARLGLGYLSQRGALVGDLSVALNLQLGAESGRRWGASRSRLSDDVVEPERDALIRALETFGVSRLIDQRVDTLSGGERRRVELARLSAAVLWCHAVGL